MDYGETTAISRRTMTLFFLIDVSGSMSGSKIGAVNQAIEEVLPEIGRISSSNADSEIKIAALTFSTGAEWLTKQPVSSENFTWTYAEAEGCTDLGIACKMLNDKLAKGEFMSSASGSFAPAIFLMSDGGPTDEYGSELNKLKQNNWFKKAIKVAVAIGDDADDSVLAEFTGSSESVVHVHTPEALKKWIKFVSVASSTIGSQSAGVGDSDNIDQVESKQDAVIEEIKQAGNDMNFTEDNNVDEW